MHRVRPGLLDQGQDPRPHRAADRLGGKGPASNQIICNRGRYDALKSANQPALQMPRLKKAAE